MILLIIEVFAAWRSYTETKPAEKVKIHPHLSQNITERSDHLQSWRVGNRNQTGNRIAMAKTIPFRQTPLARRSTALLLRRACIAFPCQVLDLLYHAAWIPTYSTSPSQQMAHFLSPSTMTLWMFIFLGYRKAHIKVYQLWSIYCLEHHPFHLWSQISMAKKEQHGNLGGAQCMQTETELHSICLEQTDILGDNPSILHPLHT